MGLRLEHPERTQTPTLGSPRGDAAVGPLALSPTGHGPASSSACVGVTSHRGRACVWVTSATTPVALCGL